MNQQEKDLLTGMLICMGYILDSSKPNRSIVTKRNWRRQAESQLERLIDKLKTL